MNPIEKRLLDTSRQRTIPQSGFSWIDRRLVREGFLRELTAPEALLYLFLCAVADKDGLSYYGDRRAAALLKLSEIAMERARDGLVRKDLVLYRAPLYQVLALPERPVGPGISAVTLPPPPRRPDRGTRSIGDVLGDLL
jgi:hypothetical protein